MISEGSRQAHSQTAHQWTRSISNQQRLQLLLGSLYEHDQKGCVPPNNVKRWWWCCMLYSKLLYLHYNMMQMISLPCPHCLLSGSGTLMYSCKMKSKASLQMEISTFTTWRKTGLLTDLDYKNFNKVEEWQGDKRFTEDTITKSWSLGNWQSVDKVSFKAKVDKKIPQGSTDNMAVLTAA